MTIIDRAQAALDGNGEPGMYDDYDVACQWSGLVRELVAEVERRGDVGREFIGAINNVLDLHYPLENSRSAMYPEPQCAECHEDHPCTTVRALEIPDDPT